ncbi:MAG: hypothetical protein EBT18_12605, partial [Gammaproteobacteria bacterium]|nr:hypothetical protein [Gammaproteobacteria bacterium]
MRLNLLSKTAALAAVLLATPSVSKAEGKTTVFEISEIQLRVSETGVMVGDDVVLTMDSNERVISGGVMYSLSMTTAVGVQVRSGSSGESVV